MATGDVKGNLKSLQTELKHARYPKDLDYTSLSRGCPKEFLPIMHYMLCDYSRPVTQLILENKMELAAKTDQKFMEAVYKVLRDIFNYVPRITGPQYFSRGFAEHKILLTRDVVFMVRNKHKQLTRGKTTGRPNTGQGGAEGNSIKSSTKKASADVVYSGQLADIPKSEEFTPSLNSTVTADSTDFSSPAPKDVGIYDDQHAVSIVVGKTPKPTQSGDCPTVETLDDAVTVRTRRQGVKGHDTGYNTEEGSPVQDSRPVIYDSDLKTHPVIRDMAFMVNDLINRVRTLEEQLETLSRTSEKAEHRNNAKMILLENKIKLLEAQIGLSKSDSTRSSSSSEGEGCHLETVFEEESIIKSSSGVISPPSPEILRDNDVGPLIVSTPKDEAGDFSRHV